MDDAISRADVDQTVEDNILCYTHSDRAIDQDPDTECHRAIRTALRMLRKDLRKLPSAQPEYEELTPEEAVSEIVSGSITSVWYWVDFVIRLKQMGYAICRKR